LLGIYAASSVLLREENFILLRFLAVLWCAFLMLIQPTFADPLPEGKKIFSANCSACHIGGTNVIVSEKTLQTEALEKYAMNSLEAIQTQIYNGKSAMPAFGGRLTDEEITAVAQYVLQQAENGWQ
jgi:cytochrome c6